ncbi:MAG: ABC transporter ATP-binding protein [Acidobacteria bacterium]|nr:ABC transporter ATP-binding protein [Acidobacteriota bacterium]MCB9377409.1 ABC transporter ATP-binding protein [Holophagales bacterium]
MSGSADRIVFAGVSKFYGEVLGVNRIDLEIGPGITSLVGPNGSGKSTLMNLMAGLLFPDEGRVEVLGLTARAPERLGRAIGYCTQFDSYPRGITGWDFVYLYLRLHGLARDEAEERARTAIERVGMTSAARRRIGGYSKGMKQRIKLAQAVAHRPQVLILDEPLNGLDPLARAEALELFRAEAAAGRHVVLSSHVLHEVDELSDRVVLVHGGYIVAEGAIEGVRDEMSAERPLQVLVRCPEPGRLAARLFTEDSVVEAQIDPDKRGVRIRTESAERFYLLLNRLAAEGVVDVEQVLPADDDVQSVYRYLIGSHAQGAS